jgi:hypothetical protein
MSKTKEFYHEQICEGLYGSTEDQEMDAAYENWKKQEEDPAYVKHIEEEAEKAEFFRVFEASGRFPF